MPKSLEKIIESKKNFEYTDNGKIRCKLTGHEIPNRKEDFLAYLKVIFYII